VQVLEQFQWEKNAEIKMVERAHVSFVFIGQRNVVWLDTLL
jgi:hypothetical protein